MMTLSVQIVRALPAFTLDIDAQFALSGVTGILGPSGAGKTTLLRAIAGLDTRQTGRIQFGDSLWFDSDHHIDMPTHKRGVGYVFQDARLLPFTDVAGNLRFADQRSRHRSGSVTWDDVVAALDLRPLLERMPAMLSGGERQRVALARALLTRPQLLLLDEPLSANDIQRKKDVLPYIRRLSTHFSVPMIYVSHALDEMVALSDRLLVLRDGRPVVHDTTEVVLRRLDLPEVSAPRDAGAIFVGQVVAHDKALQLSTLSLGSQHIFVPGLSESINTEVRLQIHSHDVAIALEAPKALSIRNILAGRVVDIDADPESPYAEVLIDINDGLLRSRITRASCLELGLSAGDNVYALIKTVSVNNTAAF